MVVAVVMVMAVEASGYQGGSGSVPWSPLSVNQSIGLIRSHCFSSAFFPRGIEILPPVTPASGPFFLIDGRTDGPARRRKIQPWADGRIGLEAEFLSRVLFRPGWVRGVDKGRWKGMWCVYVG
ncbi:hypothetical protein BO99DRAFT_153422 [Aspergillus violaceofuscus CBS 115571]|uniref:Secreted protein n=1 Tax=Aspergillus violaceofuscus (strain CBS 115571) TaxID=1450538 RepID=A0A2V5HHB2_ASPV1|nr:hypothetical protein BO99DRAFT_153422 [Aspergillus violaceofuscus CBS 115571]